MDEEEEEEDRAVIKKTRSNEMKKHRHKYKKQSSNNCVSNIYKMEDSCISRTLCGCVQFSKYNLVVLVLCLMTMCARGLHLKAQGFGGGNDGDPAPGRSPGPPQAHVKRDLFGPTWPDIDDKTSMVDDESTIFVSAGDISYESYVENSSEVETPWCDAYASASSYTPGSANDVSFNLSHRLFVVEDGLVPGITYKVQLHFALEVKDYSLTSLYNGNMPPDNGNPSCAMEEVSEQKDAIKVNGHRPSEGVIGFNWTISPTPEIRSANISFRIRYRLEGTDVVLESYYNFVVLQDCRLRLWNEKSNFTWLSLPRDGRKSIRNCVISFPRTTGFPIYDQGPGLVITITRLNVPCSLGRLVFNSTSSPGQQLCGKLEEIPAPGREIYFPYNSVPPKLLTTGNAVFELSYRFVDYCFNITYTSKNGSFEVRSSSTLHCNYRILLPFGYRVSLTLKIGRVALENSNSLPSVHVPERLRVSTLNPDDPDPTCSGFLVRLWDGPTSWTHCALTGDPVRELHVISRENRIALRVTSKPLENQPSLWLKYESVAIPELVQQCEFGWIGIKQFCVTSVEDRKLSWEDAEKECARKGGHLLSIRSEQMQGVVDNLLKYSPSYMDHNAYWIGATDSAFEGDFQWVDGYPFTYTNWFPGWGKFEHTKQPNDDGLSEQDCVELRRSYHIPNIATSPVTYTQRLTPSFMWNDRDCSTLNYFLCEKLKKGADPFEEQQSECNRTVILTSEQPRAIVTSPGFPRTYPDNMECYTQVQAPHGFRLLLEFDELVLEHETHYDMLEVIEQNNASERPWRVCGDWSQKLKLLRHVTQNNAVLMHFVSDYSHHFGGYKARVSMERANTECADDRLQMFNNSCYLFVSYPEVTWQTAKQICKGMKSELASVHSPEEEKFIVTKIRESREYSTSTIYWLGGQQDGDNSWHWVDGTILSYTAWLSVPSRESSADLYCLSLQWVASPSPLLPSSLYWQPQICVNVGGYICKKENQVSGSALNLNGTVNGTEGRLTSPRFPASYYHNLDYYVTLIAPESSRIVVKFSRLDLEAQPDCLYDFLELQGGICSTDSPPRRLCGHYYDPSDLERLNFVSEGNDLAVHFHSDYSISGGGFAFTWYSVDVSGCPLQTLTAKEGVISSPNYPQFLLARLDCSTTILAPVGRRIWLQITDCSILTSESVLEFNLGGDTQVVRPFIPNGRISDGVFVSVGERLQVRLKTGDFPRGRGFRAIYKTVQSVKEHRVIELSNISGGNLYHVNYPQEPPPDLDFTDRLVAPIGRVIHLQFHQAVPSIPSFLEDEDIRGTCPEGRGIIEVRDNYADSNGTWWRLCEASKADGDVPPLAISSYLNTLHVRQINQGNGRGVRVNASLSIREDINYKSKLLRGSAESLVESCKPNPCLNGGKCASNGNKRSCQCVGHFTGMFCALTLCELDPCLFGRCELTPNGFTCHCSRGYQGDVCDTKQKPCADNPCEGRGECIERPDSTFHCRCFAWWEGSRCEHRMMHIPYKPLSQRMLQEPFWLGLITVTVVLAVLGLFWCAKRHFPEKLEKLLAEEADRGRHCHISGRTPSLREQLSGPMYTANPLGVTTSGGGSTNGPPRTLFGRLGIRKPSLLSLSSPLVPPAHTARTFSLDDLLKPPPRRTPSPRKKRNNSSPIVKKTAAAEKKQILQQLVMPAVRRASEDAIGMATLRLQGEDMIDIQDAETSFSSKEDAARVLEQNQKQEKKVTFARLLNKVSSEMSSGSEMEVNSSCGGVSSVSITVGGVVVNPPSPTSELKSPHSTSSNQGSDSLSSSEIALALPMTGDVAKRPGRLLLGPPKTSSADSILAMFRSFSSTSAINGGHGSSSVMSASTTPTASSPQDDIAGSDESSTATPISTSSGPPDSPPLFTRRHTIQVSVLDPLSAQKSAANSCSSNLLHAPSILLEAPNKCLSPIREVPTPSPSPALTPVMSRHQMLSPLPAQKSNSLLVPVPLYSKPPNKLDLPPPSMSLPLEEMSVQLNSPPPLSIAVPVSAATNALMIPTLTVQQPSPTRSPPPVHICPGSPPPHKEKTLPRGKFLKELDKPTSLDLPVPPPLITVTCSMSEVESDTDSPATKSSVGNSGGMCYLSPFSMCSRADRTTSESNLSSSGYSSMASPGPSRCGSNNPLCPPDSEDPHHNIRRPSPLLKTPSGIDEKGRPVGCCHRGRSDSETLSDDPQVESNDEGFGTDHLEEKIEDGELKSAKELEVFIGMELLESGKTLIELPTSPSRIKHCGSIESDLQCKTLSPRNVKHCASIEADLNCYRLIAPPPNFKVRHCNSIDESLDITKAYKTSKVKHCGSIDENLSSKTKTTFQLPSIIVDADPSCNDVHCSPVSSRSESPLSDKTGGLGRFSPMFYGRLTDSDGIYDCASSDCCKMAAHRKPSGRRKERRRSKSPAPKDNPTQILLDVPGKTLEPSCRHSVRNKPSPKRRARTQQLASSTSSSSSESLNSIREVTMCLGTGEKCSESGWAVSPDGWVSDTKRVNSNEASGEETGEDVTSQMLPKETGVKPSKKLCRMRTIGHQIRFLRRLETSLKRRESPERNILATTPLLVQPPTNTVRRSTSGGRLGRLSRHRATVSDEPLLTPEDLAWRRVTITGSGHTD